jgi:hypothetical protein
MITKKSSTVWKPYVVPMTCESVSVYIQHNIHVYSASRELRFCSCLCCFGTKLSMFVLSYPRVDRLTIHMYSMHKFEKHWE